MRHVLPFLLAALLAMNPSARAQVGDNAELAALYRQDQAARTNGANIDWATVSREDAGRRARVLALMREGGLRTAVDHEHAAMIFQHGQGLEDIRIAHALSTLAATLAPDTPRYRWRVAASWDRIMATQLQPQWYGTQYQGSDAGVFLYPVAEDAVDDAGRARMGVPSLAQARARVDEVARSMGQQVRPHPPTIGQLRHERRAAGTVAPWTRRAPAA